MPDKNGRFGDFGGRFVPETVMPVLFELEESYEKFKNDPEFISLKEELERLFKQKKLSEVSQEEMNANIGALNKIHEKIKELNRQNNLLSNKYNNDPKYARIHKRLLERGNISKNITLKPVTAVFRVCQERQGIKSSSGRFHTRRFACKQSVADVQQARHFFNSCHINVIFLRVFNK